MANARSPWRVLRPVLLASAATLTWLAFSTSAATADSSADSLLGGVTTSVSSLTAPLTGSAGAEPIAAIPAPATPSPGLLQPVAGSITGAADQVVAGLPVMNHLVPAGAVSTVSDPVAATVDDAAALVDTITPSLVEAVPVLEPVLQPVVELVNGIVPPSASLLELEVAGFDPTAEIAGDAAAAPALANQGAEFRASSVGPAAGASASQQDWAGAPFADALADSGSQSAWAEVPVTVDPSPVPAPAPPGPSTASGSGASPSGSSGSAAWLDTFGLNLPHAGVVPLRGSSEHAPTPVSFDPGSSPD